MPTRVKTHWIALLLAALAVRGSTASAQTRYTSAGSLPAFRSDRELARYLRGIMEERRTRQRVGIPAPLPSSAAADAPAAAPAAAARGAESITNTQHAGVDEGDIVKLHGDHLVILRRGRLFTVGVGDGDLRAVSMADAFGPGIDPSSTWYDELLVWGDKVVVVGYSYERGGTEIGVFRIDGRGHLHYLSTYHLRSNDYYSSRNYASRLVGSTLIFYSPLYLPDNLEDPLAALPAMRRWHAGAGAGEFRRIVSSRRVYRAARRVGDSGELALHTVTSCDLAAPELTCTATVVAAPPGRVFYVSPSAVYVWTSDWPDGSPVVARRSSDHATPAMVFRMPLDGSRPSALGVAGSPVDQFSFLESEDGYLNVLVRSEAAGDAMWLPEAAGGSVSLLRVAIERFGDGSGVAPRSSYRELPTPQGSTFQNRFVGDYLLYSTGNGWGSPAQSTSELYVLPWSGGRVARLELSHGVDRIEAMGPDAVVVGTDGQDLHFSGIRLDRRPQLAQRFTLPGASQGELRSHGFFYRPDGPRSGVLGLPVRGPGRPGYEHLFDGSASIVFLRNDGRQFAQLGTLAAHDEGAVDDACRASCVDWYGNARPLFLRGRVLALLGYELVEGSVAGGRIREAQRLDFAPHALRAVSR